ncbi:MAG: tRNA guanosine(34) transglycosylase Tgt [Micavibrio sp. TMED27]|nr:tRNA guanosine(34) transglycosylase Tgt [Micavibrio sp.]OUT91988.1 MAG: tRNA guanosine(34) transglycosylase Tgt [Micavibrio sp. TMED27]|tara:strand:- start:738 stop:1922 length:1185 start_codon:yes stop_codon:yes gene_type:complete
MLTYPNFSFDITHKDQKSGARIGRLKTPHGEIETPNYIFCGTKATVKGVTPDQLHELKTDIILANTYHLMLQPGADLVEKLGGLHKFMGWNGPMLTDSGGFQVFSLGEGTMANEIKGKNTGKHDNKSLISITEEGCVFKSYIDGRKIKLTPESATHIQQQLGADLFMQFDECTPYHVDKEYTARSMEMSMRWGDRCLSEFERRHNGKQAMYGIIQGGVHSDLRRVSAEYTADRPFFGTAVGGCLGGTEEEMELVVRESLPHAHPERPVHFLGIGQLKDVFRFVRLGVDTFDCVIPTRLARHGTAFMKGVPGETINLKNAKFREDHTPLDEGNNVSASCNFSKAYLHHLFKAGEMLGMQLLAQHNIATINRLMREVRAAIKAGTLDELEKEWIPK